MNIPTDKAADGYRYASLSYVDRSVVNLYERIRGRIVKVGSLPSDQWDRIDKWVMGGGQ